MIQLILSVGYILKPECTAATPKVKSSQPLPTVRNPASRIILANSAWGGNRAMDSTKYWYESRSFAIKCPRVGMISNEYVWYILVVNKPKRQENFGVRFRCRKKCKWMHKIENILVDEGVFYLSEFQTHESASGFQHAVRLFKDSVYVCAVSNSESDRVGVDGFGRNCCKVFCISDRKRDLRTCTTIEKKMKVNKRYTLIKES